MQCTCSLHLRVRCVPCIIINRISHWVTQILIQYLRDSFLYLRTETAENSRQKRQVRVKLQYNLWIWWYDRFGIEPCRSFLFRGYAPVYGRCPILSAEICRMQSDQARKNIDRFIRHANAVRKQCVGLRYSAFIGGCDMQNWRRVTCIQSYGASEFSEIESDGFKVRTQGKILTKRAE